MSEVFHANIGACHRCLYRQAGCAGPCVCTIDGRDIIDHATAGDCPKGFHAQGVDSPSPQPSRGLGDTIAKITHAVGIEPCGGCERRRQILNRMAPYRDNRETD